MGRIGLGTSAAAVAVVLALAMGACGDEGDPPPPTGPLADALEGIRGGSEHGALGIGWAEPRLVEDSGAGKELIADALGPNARTVVEAGPALRRRFGLDPLSADRLISVGGSYAFGLRLDGVDGRRLGRALTRADGRSRQDGGLQLLDSGGYAQVPDRLLRAGVLGLGARAAFSRELSVLAISEDARATLLGRADRPAALDYPIYRAAADCLGDAVAVRMVPERLLLSSEFGVDLVAVGVAGEREILCVLGGTAERADTIAATLEASLAPDAREPRSGEPIDEILDAVEVEVASYEDVQVVRAELTRAADRPPGFLFGTISSGGVVDLVTGS